MSKAILYFVKFDCPNCGQEHYEFEYDQYDFCKNCNTNFNKIDWDEVRDRTNIEDLKLKVEVENKDKIKFIWMKDED